ncbi:MAG: hypothetical protein Q9184_000008 [Pyrenodesmia sp. 2 TL-2023]
MATQVEYVKLAQTLPAKLFKFFARYPPVSKSAAGLGTSAEEGATSILTSINTSSTDLNATLAESTIRPSLAPSNKPNPFKPHKHPETGRWHDPVYSLRRQADLVKLARVNGVEELLPYTFKGSEGTKRREEHGLRVKGTGIGQRVKGKAWERTMKSRLEKRKQAMLGMPTLVQQWKQVRFLVAVLFYPNLTLCKAWSWPWLEKVSEVTSFEVETTWTHSR